MKKVLSLLLVVLLCILVSACGKQKASPVEDFEYEFEDGEAIITGYIGSDLDIVIPYEIEERPVTVIGKEAFKGYDMKSIVVPEGVHTIEYCAFEDCNVLEKISLPDSIREIANSSYAFYDTQWYNNQPDGVLYIDNVLVGVKGENYFSFHKSKQDTPTCEVKNGTKIILSNAFFYEKTLMKVVIPDSVEYIGGALFNSDIVKIYGKTGSVAEIYANENGIPFVAE